MTDDVATAPDLVDDDTRSSALEPRIDPTSIEGIYRKGMAEGGAGANAGNPRSPQGVEIVPSFSLAYTDSQKPNLPDAVDEEMTRIADGAGIGQEPVERRANTMIFDKREGNFVIQHEEHGTGVTSQDHTAS